MEATAAKEWLREAILSLGADVCGFAGADAFSGAPEGFRPTDVFPACRSVVSLGVALPKGALSAEPRILYAHCNGLAPQLLDQIALQAARLIERELDALAVPVPSDGPYDAWDPDTLTGRGLISVKHAAVLAGLGTLGKNTLLLHPRFGNRLTLGAVLTDAVLPGDPPAKSVCIPGCRKCLDNCPVGALDGDGHTNQLLCRPNTYGVNARGFSVCLCNRCRTVCPMRFGAPEDRRRPG